VVSICLFVPCRLPTLLHGPGCNLGEWWQCTVVVHYWVDLQLVHGFRCCVNIQQQQPFYGPLSGTVRVSQYQKKHSPTHHPDHHPIFISFFHLPRSTASSLFKLHAWQSFCTTSFHVLIAPNAKYQRVLVLCLCLVVNCIMTVCVCNYAINNEAIFMFCSLAVLDPRVGHTMDVLSPFISILCRYD